jgi:hypothetical protein
VGLEQQLADRKALVGVDALAGRVVVVEIRVAVAGAGAVHGLMQRLVGVFGHAAVSFDSARNEVRVTSDWGSRAVDQVVSLVELGLAEDGIRSATVAVGDHAYTIGAT